MDDPPWVRKTLPQRPESSTSKSSSEPQRELLLVFFIHGFKGTDSTFGSFPERLQHLLAETIENTDVECIVFPAYETKGELTEAVERFADWLTQLTLEKEMEKGLGGGAGKSKIVLCGHSMGGLVAADTLIALADSRPDKQAPLWPKIVACIAFDTPYLGVHPFVFKNSATKAAEYVTTARTMATDVASAFNYFSGKKSTAGLKPLNLLAPPPAPAPAVSDPAPAVSQFRSSWQKWALPAAYTVGGAVVAGAAAGTALWKREDIGNGYSWATDHMRYLGTLWDEKKLEVRLERLIGLQEEIGVVFRTYYTYLPPRPPRYNSPRTFIYVPKSSSPFGPYFQSMRNRLAEDEIQAHTGMFEPSTNDAYYEFGLETAKVIREGVVRARGVVGVKEIQKEVQDEVVKVKELEAKEADKEIELNAVDNEAEVDNEVEGKAEERKDLREGGEVPHEAEVMMEGVEAATGESERETDKADNVQELGGTE